MMELLLNQGANVELKRSSDLTPLLTACACGFLQGAQVLIKHGANIYAKTQSGSTCLILAAKKEHSAVVSYLLDQESCPVNEADKNGFTALHYVVLSNNASMTSKLISKGSDINAQSTCGQVPVFLATKYACSSSLKILLEGGADPNYGNCAFWHAMEQLNIDAIHMLLIHGAKLTRLRQDGISALDLAITKEDPTLMTLLLDRGFNIEHKCGQGCTPLMKACSLGYSKGVELLVTRGAFMNAQNKDGETPVFIAVEKNSMECLKILLEAGADPDVFTKNGESAILEAITNDNVEAVKLLITHEATIDVQNENGESPVSRAVRYNCIGPLRVLLRAGANPNILTKAIIDGDSALLQAVRYDNLKAIRLLIKSRVDIEARTQDGLTSLLLAAKKKHFDIVSYFIEKCSCDLNAIGRDGYSALHYIAIVNHRDLIIKLVCNGADINAQTRDRETAVYLAAKNNCIVALKALLEYGADPNIETQREAGGLSGACALHEAINEGNIESVTLLLKYGADIAAIRSDGLIPIELAISLSPQRQDIVDSLLNVSTVNKQMKKLAHKCKSAEQMLQEQRSELEDKSSRCKFTEQLLQEKTLELEDRTTRCEQAESQVKELKTELEQHSTRRELAEQTLRSMQSDMEQCICCPITLEVMRDPVIASDGHTYEREAIERWLRCKTGSPVTRQPLSSSMLIPNIAMKYIIDQCKEEISDVFHT
eukprot:g6643.t1